MRCLRGLRSSAERRSCWWWPPAKRRALAELRRRLTSREPPTAFERGIHRLGVMILRLTIFLTLFVLLMNLAFARPVLKSFLFAVALAVGLTPELLPMIMTVTLARGALRMAQKRVVVKKLAAIHDLGAMDVLCTDKTGTLTEARIALLRHPRFWTGQDSERVLDAGGPLKRPVRNRYPQPS